MSWTLRDTLLRSGPWEILPDDRPKIKAAARRYSRDPHLSKGERDYIARMWHTSVFGTRQGTRNSDRTSYRHAVKRGREGTTEASHTAGGTVTVLGPGES